MADEKQNPSGQQSSQQQTGQSQDRKPNQKQEDDQQQKGQPFHSGSGPKPELFNSVKNGPRNQ